MIKKLNKLRETAKKFIKPSDMLGGLFVFLRSLSMKSLTSLIIASLSILLLLMAQFTSCSSNNGLTTSSSRTTPSTSTSNSNNDDEPDIEDCSDRDSCEEECSKIYEDYGEKTECEDEDVDDVVELGHIYNKLKSGSYSELQDISNNNDDVDTDMLQNYLNIGTSGWIKKIQCWGDHTITDCSNDANQPGKLKNTLKWLIDEDDVAGILRDNDDSNSVLKALIEALHDSGVVAGKINEAANDCTQTTGAGRTKWYNAPVDQLKLIICKGTTANATGDEIVFDDSSDETLYVALSGLYLTSTQNIFAYTSDVGDEKGGKEVFEMAYELLNGICNEVSDGDSNNHKIACRRAMFCWTYFKLEPTASNDEINDDDLDNFIKVHKSDLETSGKSNYNKCSPTAFDDYI